MKIKNILLCGLGAIALVSCNDFLGGDEEAPSKFGQNIVYGSVTQANNALNAAYASLTSGNSFGNMLYNSMMLNSDVDFTTNTNSEATNTTPKRFDVDARDGNSEKLYNALMAGIKDANVFLDGMEESSLREGPDSLQAKHMIGQAKVLRAINYYELMWYFGDVPFAMESAYKTGVISPEVKTRDVIAETLIKDLIAVAPDMYSDKETDKVQSVEYVSQEACYAMIARLAMQAAGYRLVSAGTTGYEMQQPEATVRNKYYKIALDYTDSIINRKGHSLGKNYREVFIDECNYKVAAGDDPIFEIPFAKKTSGNFGYAQGPTVSKNSSNVSPFSQGVCNGGVRLSSFYRFSFGENDVRKDYVCGLWYYDAQGVPTPRLDFTNHNNKWSKMWTSTGLGAETEGSTGINMPYIRYADVLLTNAEAANELGDIAQAKKDLKVVRERAFRGADNQSSMVNDYVDAIATKDAMTDAILNERAWEFAGENIRWKDLVRYNKYSEVIAKTFFLYVAAGQLAEDGQSVYLDAVSSYDNVDYANVLAPTYDFCRVNRTDVNPNFANSSAYQLYFVNVDVPTATPKTKPNAYELVNKYGKYSFKTAKECGGTDESKDWQEAKFIANFYKDGEGLRDELRYSMYGYIYLDVADNVHIRQNATSYTTFNQAVTKDTFKDTSKFPAVRYILPLPAEVISRGGYTNGYGY